MSQGRVRGPVSVLASAAAVVALMAVLFFGASRQGTRWTLTQYPQVNGAQGLCYALESEKGELILIDGGWQENSELLLDLIMAHGSRVDAWIITHSHQDHASAFAHLMSGEFDIDLAALYAPDLPREVYTPEVSSRYDGGYETYEAFREIAEACPATQFVHSGETYRVCGLTMKILNAYERGNDWGDVDPENNGSLMFRLEGREDSILFCGDVTKRLADSLLDRYGEELAAEYLQVAHHGIGATMPHRFNHAVRPRVAFFDLPASWNLSDKTSQKRRQALEREGTLCYNLDGAPRSFPFR